jgi:hypothetical protein
LFKFHLVSLLFTNFYFMAFLKNKSSVMRSPYCVQAPPPPFNLWMTGSILKKLGMCIKAPEFVSLAKKIRGLSPRANCLIHRSLLSVIPALQPHMSLKQNLNIAWIPSWSLVRQYPNSCLNTYTRHRETVFIYHATETICGIHHKSLSSVIPTL